MIFYKCSKGTKNIKEIEYMKELQVEKTYWAAVSGGKDSLKMLHIILENPQNTH